MTTYDLDVRGVQLHLSEVGSGPTILFLHGLHGLDPAAKCFEQLAQRFRLLLPVHPGFGLTHREPWCNTVHDLAYLYLDLIRGLDLSEVHLIGSSLGGWIAAEMAVRCEDRLADLVLVDPLGIKVGDRWTRDITDIFATEPAEVLRLAFHVPPPPVDYQTLSDDEVKAQLRNGEGTAIYGWEPYMHDPKLRRLLGRITLPALIIWGAADGIVNVDYGRAYRESLPNSEMVVIDRAGHYPHLEQPQAFIDHVDQFFATRGSIKVG